MKYDIIILYYIVNGRIKLHHNEICEHNEYVKVINSIKDLFEVLLSIPNEMIE